MNYDLSLLNSMNYDFYSTINVMNYDLNCD